jgi:hypothetical protein
MSDADENLLRSRLRIMQLIAGSLLAGVLALLAVVLYVVLVRNEGKGANPPPDRPPVSLVAVLAVAVTAPLALVLPGIRTRAAVREIAAGTWRAPADSLRTFAGDADKLLHVRQTTMIIALALLEGAAFLGCIAYLNEAQPFALAAVAVPLLLMLATFPTEGRMRDWLQLQTGRIAEARQLGGNVRDEG